MKKEPSDIKRTVYRVASIHLLIFILISCNPAMQTENIVASSPTSSTEPLPILPALYQSPFLNPSDVPHTYVKDTCQYLHNKWNPFNAAPGTIVMVIMFKQISYSTELKKIITELQVQDFHAINTKQLLAFLERNTMIPSRSVLLIQDGSFEAKYFDENFRENFDTLGWTVVNGWVSKPDLPGSILTDNVRLEKEGWVDHQAQGVTNGTVLTDETSKVVIARELENSLTAFADYYGKIPYAFIWPNGGFGLRPVQAARQLGYKLGFTSNSRGPVMYNWVPLADAFDPKRPTLIPEGPIQDPLMTLPRYSADEVSNSIDGVRLIGQESALYQEANKTAELNYYDIVCKSTYGEIPTP